MTATAKLGTRDMVLVALMTALMAVCSWISIPATVPFTLQTLGVFLACSLLGGKRGSLAVFLYILLGAVGLPVCFGDMGYETPDPALLRQAAEKACVAGSTVHHMPFPVTPDLLYSALWEADKVGRRFQETH